MKRKLSTALSVKVFNPLVRHAARSGVAQAMPDDDPVARLRTMPRVHAASVRAMGSELLSVRIDLEKEVDAKAAA